MNYIFLNKTCFSLYIKLYRNFGKMNNSNLLQIVNLKLLYIMNTLSLFLCMLSIIYVIYLICFMWAIDIY